MSVDYGRLKPFAYLDAEKTHLYRALMGLFVEAKAHFLIHLRAAEILAGLGEHLGNTDNLPGEVDSALLQLCEWGNLRRTQDTDVRTVEEFYRPRYLYQLTREGEAAERAVRAYEDIIVHPGELQTAALGVIREQLQSLLTQADSAEIDVKKIHLTLSTLRTYFDQLTTKAQIFIGSIQRAIDLHGYEIDVFILYKEKLIDYLERFIGELLIAADEIARIIHQLEHADIERMLQAAAAHDLVDAMTAGPDELQKAEREWVLRWAGLTKWFVTTKDTPSQADTLRSCARSAIPSLLIAISGIHDRRVAKCDRPTDLKLLARWFAQAESDAEAHRLWRAAFALNSARHLRIDALTLDARDQNPVALTASWLQSDPILISPRLRTTGEQHRRGRPANVIDRTAEKERLALLAQQEADQIEAARQRIATNQLTKLSDFSLLNRSEFQLLLDLLGKALASQKAPDAKVVTASSDGSLEISLWPTDDHAQATIVTSDGDFRGRDYYLQIRDLTDGAQQLVDPAVVNRLESVVNKVYQPVE